MVKKNFAEVIINNKCKETDRAYSYAVPEELLAEAKEGSRVIVPFGIGNKQTEGYIVGLKDTVDFDASKIKSIIRVLDSEPVISKNMLELAFWMRHKYLCYFIDAIQAIIPSPVRIKSRYTLILKDSEKAYAKLEGTNSNIMLEIVDYIDQNGGNAKLEEVRGYFGERKVDYYIRKLQEMGLLEKLQTLENKTGKKFERQLYLNDSIRCKIKGNAVKQKEVIEAVSKNPGVGFTKLRKMCPGCEAAVRTLVSRGFLKVVEREEYREVNNTIIKEKRHELTEEQKNAVVKIREFFHKGKNVLLHGVTGSGKTEVYLELIEENLIKGKDSIMLVPEISLTPQMVSRFKNRFGDKVAVMHSSLSEGEKYDEWRRIKRGLAKIVVGARSAVFAPFSNLSLIIIDEEHENTYKSDIKPKYLTREVAEKRCELEGARLILGSATPSVETYYMAERGKLGLVELPHRVNGTDMPEIEVIDMREELKNGNKTIFSESLVNNILEKLKNGDQIILFLNRRGHSTFVSCRECGLVMKCPRCNIPYTYHMKENKLICHYCGYEKETPKVCPKCKGNKIRYFGVGTQKLEKEFQKKFSISNVLRMDADTTSRKNSHQEILDKYRRKESKVLLGTQMISKGLDFPDVTLVGVITADTSINLPDFRSAERTFQMIAQVAGRSGRGKKSGKVIVQTYSPDHYSIVHAKNHDYKSFYAEEIKLRKALAYPPYTSLASLIISGTNEQEVIKLANEISQFLDSIKHKYGNVEKLGPAAAAIARIKNRFRWQIVLKSTEEENLRKMLAAMLEKNFEGQSNASISIDINPQSMI